MPNGHGGYPYMGGPIALALLFALLLFLNLNPESLAGRARPILALVVAGWFGCKLAYHLHFRRLDEYEGAYIEPEARRRGRSRYRVACVMYAAVSVYLGHLAIEWRGQELPF